MMIDLPLIALGGVLGSSHCIGMCGGFALSIGLGARSPLGNLARQIAYGSGRVFTYAFLGAAAGFAGAWFERRSGALVHAQSILSLVAGVLLIAFGLVSLGVLPRLTRGVGLGSGGACLARSFVGPFLRSPRWHHVFLAGVFNGLLPCGLVYGYLALATSAASVPAGLATMAAFGAGTIPVMALTGMGATILSLPARRRLFQVAGVCVLLTGILSVNRAFAFWDAGTAACCPACEPTSR